MFVGCSCDCETREEIFWAHGSGQILWSWIGNHRPRRPIAPQPGRLEGKTRFALACPEVSRSWSWDRRTRRAYIDDAHDSTSVRCGVMLMSELMVTPSTRMELTHWVPFSWPWRWPCEFRLSRCDRHSSEWVVLIQPQRHDKRAAYDDTVYIVDKTTHGKGDEEPAPYCCRKSSSVSLATRSPCQPEDDKSSWWHVTEGPVCLCAGSCSWKQNKTYLLIITDFPVTDLITQGPTLAKQEHEL